MAILEQPPTPGARSGILERLRAALPDLRPAERRVAEHILANPGQAIALSISEFAALCNVAQATVSRLCRSIGTSNYAALRLGLANDLAMQSPTDDQNTTPAVSGVSGLPALLEGLNTSSHLPQVAYALRHASHVEIWPTPDFASTGGLLADRLTALAIPATCALAPSRWTARLAGLPAGVIVVLLASMKDSVITMGLAAAHAANVRVVCCTTRPAAEHLQAADWIVPLPAHSSIDLVGLALVETLVGEVAEQSKIAGPDGPASPWRPWPHTRSIFLPTPGDPLPAVLLTHEEPPRKRPLVIYFSGFGSSIENVLPGRRNNANTVCPRIVAPLLNAGYHVLVVETQAHGLRKRSWEESVTLLQESFRGKDRDLLAAIRAEASFLVDGILALDITEHENALAVVGQSWGGLHSLLTLAGDARITGGVAMMPLIHIPCLHPFAGLEGAPRIIAEEPGAWMGTYLAPRPLLMLAGAQDEVTPAHYTQEFVTAIRPAYMAAHANEHLEYKLLPDLGHQYDPRQVDAVVAWLDRYLPVSPSATFTTKRAREA